jgi:hypothetical protein
MHPIRLRLTLAFFFTGIFSLILHRTELKTAYACSYIAHVANISVIHTIQYILTIILITARQELLVGHPDTTPI